VGCCVGAEAATGVVNGEGEIHGLPGLFIADGSVVPDSLGGPPTLTIAAWAEHVGDSLVAKLAAD